MAEKHLTETAWKAFAKGKNYKDAGLLKALAASEKAKKAGPPAQVEAYDELEKQADLLRKANKADKELTAYLDELDKTLASERKTAQQAVRAAQDASEDEEDESPALLTTKMIPLLRQVRKGEVVMKALIAVAGKETAVLVSRRSIAPARRKLMVEYLGVSGGVKYIAADCLFEENAVTFVVMSQAAGLAKKLKAALLKQTEMRLKIRVRGEDPDDLDVEGEEEPDGEAASSSPPPKEAAAPAVAAYRDKRAALQARIDRALRAGGPTAAKLQALLTFAEGKAAAGDPGAALQGLLALEKLLDASQAAAAGPAGPATGGAAGAGPATGPAAAGAAAPAPAAEGTAAAPPAAGPGDTVVDAGVAFNARLAALMPQVKEVMAGGEPLASAVKRKVTEAGALAKAKDYTAAQAGLDEVEAMLAAGSVAAPPESTTGGGESGDATADPARVAHEALVARLLPQFEAATAGPVSPELRDSLDALRRAWALADEAAEAGNHARALQIRQRIADGGLLARLIEARQQAAANPPAGGEGVRVQQRKFLLERWPRIPLELRVELASLKALIVATGEEEDPDGLFDGIDDYVENLLGSLQQEIDGAIQSGVTSGIGALIDRVRADPLMKLLVANPEQPSDRFVQVIGDALKEIEDQFADA